MCQVPWSARSATSQILDDESAPPLRLLSEDINLLGLRLDRKDWLNWNDPPGTCSHLPRSSSSSSSVLTRVYG